MVSLKGPLGGPMGPIWAHGLQRLAANTYENPMKIEIFRKYVSSENCFFQYIYLWGGLGTVFDFGQCVMLSALEMYTRWAAICSKSWLL